MTILAGDIGGTKTLLQIATDKNHSTPLAVLYEQRYLSADFPTFEELLSDFLEAAQNANVPRPLVGCIGVAGPVKTDDQGKATAKVTNLSWVLDVEKLSIEFGFSKLSLINDFQAVGYGLDALDDDELSVLQKGEAPHHVYPTPCALMGAGTGLGQGILVWRGEAGDGYYDALGSEGGHAEFCPGSDEQIELLIFLLQQKELLKYPGRVSVEDVLSGRGLVNIYHYFVNKYPAQVNASFVETMLDDDAAAAVSEAALSEKDSLARRALELFVEIYGSQAGNFALTCLATGGVYIAGGVAPKIQPLMGSTIFLRAFQNKGPMSEMMKKIPVKLVMNPQVGLKGALLVASRM